MYVVEKKPCLLITDVMKCALINRECTRGGFCNFMHLKPISHELRREMYGRKGGGGSGGGGSRRKRWAAVFLPCFFCEI